MSLRLYTSAAFFDQLRDVFPRDLAAHLHGIELVEDPELSPGQAEIRGALGVECRRLTLVWLPPVPMIDEPAWDEEEEVNAVWP